MDAAVRADWLLDELQSPDLRVVDASWFLPGQQRDARAEFEAAHIPGARFLDQDGLSDAVDGLPHSLPSAARFADRAGRLGIGAGDRIVVYDNSPLHTAARGWWLFRLFGAPHVAVLDGGLAAWRAAGGPLEAGAASCRSCRFEADADFSAVRSLADMLENLRSGQVPVVDARSAGRFSGRDPEPRPGMRSGHIPGSRNLPFAGLYAADGRLKDQEALHAVFRQAGIDPLQPFIASCGSGVTAACIVHAATVLGAAGPTLYDGSWAEWGARKDTPIATGF